MRCSDPGPNSTGRTNTLRQKRIEMHQFSVLNYPAKLGFRKAQENSRLPDVIGLLVWVNHKPGLRLLFLRQMEPSLLLLRTVFQLDVLVLTLIPGFKALLGDPLLFCYFVGFKNAFVFRVGKKVIDLVSVHQQHPGDFRYVWPTSSSSLSLWF